MNVLCWFGWRSLKQLTLINQIKPKHIMNHNFYIFIMNDIEKIRKSITHRKGLQIGRMKRSTERSTAPRGPFPGVQPLQHLDRGRVKTENDETDVLSPPVTEGSGWASWSTAGYWSGRTDSLTWKGFKLRTIYTVPHLINAAIIYYSNVLSTPHFY